MILLMEGGRDRWCVTDTGEGFNTTLCYHLLDLEMR